MQGKNMDDAQNARLSKLLQTIREVTTIMTEEWEKYKAVNVYQNGRFIKITLTDEEVDRLKAHLPSEILDLLEEAKKEWNETKPKPR